MSNPSNVGPEEGGKTQLESCLGMIRSASNDNEKMAGLLLFSHLMKTNSKLMVNTNELFKAIDVKFIVRLLNSVNVPEGCSQFIYKTLALNILSSFTESEILFHPLLVSNLTSITEVLLIDKGHAEAGQMLEDATGILLIFSRKPEGCKHLLKSNCIPIICKAVIQNAALDKCFEILKGVLLHLPQQCWEQHNSELEAVLHLYCNQFVKNQDLLKFSALDKLLVLVTSIHESKLYLRNINIFLPDLKDNIKWGIKDILQSRCKAEYKYTAINMTRYMVEFFGIEWTVTLKQKPVLDMSVAKFWLLVLSIIKTELKIIMEQDQYDEIDSKSDTIVSCYVIIEKSIEFLICSKVENLSFTDDIILKTHSILTETFDSVIQFLIQIDSQGTIGQTPVLQRPIIMATVRVLCVWLSEETKALSDKISAVLPVLVKWAKLSQNNAGTDVLLTNDFTTNDILHLLPPLCHLSADEAFCAILVREDCHILLASLFKQLCQAKQWENADYPSHFVTLCNVLLNFSVLEVQLIKTSKAFEEILECILVSIAQMKTSTLKAHFILLGLMLFRNRFQLDETQLKVLESEFILSSLSFLREVHLSLTAEQGNGHVDWDNISELWFLSVQNLIACSQTISTVNNLVCLSGWPKEVQAWIKSCNQDNKLIKDLKSALLPLSNLK